MKWTGCSTNITATAIAVALALLAPPLLLHRPVSADQTPNPSEYRVACKGKKGATEQGDDKVEMCVEKILGSAEYSWREDSNGYTIITDEDGDEAIAQFNTESGRLEPSKCKMHEKECTPEKMGIAPHLKDDELEIQKMCGAACHRSRNEPLSPTLRMARAEKRRKNAQKDDKAEDRRKLAKTTMFNLVLLIQFSNHYIRKLPSQDDFGQ